jgi:hypothetical protein
VSGERDTQRSRLGASLATCATRCIRSPASVGAVRSGDVRAEALERRRRWLSEREAFLESSLEPRERVIAVDRPTNLATLRCGSD